MTPNQSAKYEQLRIKQRALESQLRKATDKGETHQVYELSKQLTSVKKEIQAVLSK